MMVQIVRRIGECDIEPIPHVPPMTHQQAVAELQAVAEQAPSRINEFDLVYVNTDGTLGRYASWALN